MEPTLIRLLFVAAACLALTACDKAQIDTAIASIKGDPIPETYALAAVASSSEEPVVVQAIVEPPPPPPVCENYQWRAWIYDCHGNNLGEAP